MIDSAAIVAATFVKQVDWHRSLSSTNTRALELAGDERVELPLLVIADEQTAGRGRGDHQWWSAPGALTFSLVLDSDILHVAQRDWPQLSLATAAAIADVVNQLLPDLRATVKPPNDVLLDQKKIAGILIESPGGSPQVSDCLVVGIGMNVNNSWTNAPQELSSTGTALCDHSQKTFDLSQVLVDVLTALESRYEQLPREDQK